MPDKLLTKRIVFTLIMCALFMSEACDFKPGQQAGTPDEWMRSNNILNGSRNIDSLAALAENYINAGNKSDAIKAYRRMGNLSRESDDFAKAIEYHNRAMSIAESIGDKVELIICLNQLGTDYRRMGAYEDASTFHYLALKYCEQSDDKTSDYMLKNKTMSLNGIGNVYLTLGNLDAAYSAFYSALEGEKKMDSRLGMAINYANLGTIFEKKGMYDLAKEYYEYSMEQNRLAKSNLGISLCHNHFGRLAELRGDFDEALREYHAAYDIMEKSSDRWHWMEACLAIAKGNIAKGDMETALEYLKRAEATACELQSKDYLASVYEIKYNYFQKKGDYRQAFDNYKLSRQYADSALSLKNVNHIHNLRIHHETEKKELEIAALEGEKRLSFAGVVVLAMTGAVFFFLWRLAIQKRRVSEHQRLLAEQQIKQLDREKQLVATQAVLDGETRERTRLARDLHDGLGSMLTGVKLNLPELKQGVTPGNADVERFNKALGLLDESVREMRRVAHHLMPDSLSRFGLKSAVDDFCRNLSPNIVFDYFGEEARLEPNLEVVIYRSIHELVNNALKYSGASQIMVQIMQEPERIAFIVQDDGCGFDPDVAAEGTGLRNVKTRIASFGGNFRIDSKAGEGTEVIVELRIKN